jgi:hypothetical protein
MAEVTFLRSFGDDGVHVAELEDQERLAELVETYVDRIAAATHRGRDTGSSAFRCHAAEPHRCLHPAARH